MQCKTFILHMMSDYTVSDLKRFNGILPCLLANDGWEMEISHPPCCHVEFQHQLMIHSSIGTVNIVGHIDRNYYHWAQSGHQMWTLTYNRFMSLCVSHTTNTITNQKWQIINVLHSLSKAMKVDHKPKQVDMLARVNDKSNLLLMLSGGISASCDGGQPL
jgi:hypothetical protein